MAGLHRKTTFEKGGCVWQEFFNGGMSEKMNVLKNQKCCDDIDANDGIGLMYDIKGKDSFSCIIGDFIKPDAAVPEGVFTRRIPKCINAHVQIEGNNVPDILASAYLLITEAIEKTGREIDFDNFYWGEIYTHERYRDPLKRGEKVIIDYIMPVKAV